MWELDRKDSYYPFRMYGVRDYLNGMNDLVHYTKKMLWALPKPYNPRDPQPFIPVVYPAGSVPKLSLAAKQKLNIKRRRERRNRRAAR